MTQKLKVTPLIFIENYKYNESKMVFPQMQGVGVRPLWKIPQLFLTLPLHLCLNLDKKLTKQHVIEYTDKKENL